MVRKILLFSAMAYWRRYGTKRFINKFFELIAKKLGVYWVSSRFCRDPYQLWIEQNEPRKDELERQKRIKFGYQPEISLILPVYRPRIKWLEEAIESVLSQTYPNWQLCISDCSQDQEIAKVLSDYSIKDRRIKVKFIDYRLGIAENSNQALEMVEGEYVGFLDHDDTLAPFALFQCAKLLNRHRNADLIYSDEDKLSPNSSRRFDPHFKPDWSPDTLLSYNYITHFVLIRKKIVDEISGFRLEYEGSQDYDLLLRTIEKTENIHHIAKVLYHWREHKSSVSINPQAKPYAAQTACLAVKDHLKRIGREADVKAGKFVGHCEVRYKLKGNPLVSIIIPNKDHYEILKNCLDSISTKTTYKNYEVIIVDNNSAQDELRNYYQQLSKKNQKVRVLSWGSTFNYSMINNFAAHHAKGEFLLLLNNDTEVIAGDWLERMLEFAQREDVGAVGAKLLYKDNTIQHGGIALGIGEVAGHIYKGLPSGSLGYYGRAAVVHNVTAVTGACLMIEKEKFLAVGGLDERFKVSFGDVDLCLKLIDEGKFNVWTPYSVLYHLESETRGMDDKAFKIDLVEKEAQLFWLKWQAKTKGADRYFNYLSTQLCR